MSYHYHLTPFVPFVSFVKDLGKKWFAFSLIEEDIFELKKRVSEVLDEK